MQKSEDFQEIPLDNNNTYSLINNHEFQVSEYQRMTGCTLKIKWGQTTSETKQTN